MKRVPEPELMIDPVQVSAYAEADFNDPHSNFINLLKEYTSQIDEVRTALDLGCGPGDITFRFADAFPEAAIDAVDGSLEMLHYARHMAEERPGFSGRISYIHSMIHEFYTDKNYDLIYTNSLLHHLPEPSLLWEKIREMSRPGTLIFVMDLLRPVTVNEARRLMELYTKGEPEVLRRDFYNSLLAAFEPDEIVRQLKVAGLTTLRVKQVSDRHVIIYGEM